MAVITVYTGSSARKTEQRIWLSQLNLFSANVRQAVIIKQATGRCFVFFSFWNRNVNTANRQAQSVNDH